jgi:hypothetical protein
MGLWLSMQNFKPKLISDAIPGDAMYPNTGCGLGHVIWPHKVLVRFHLNCYFISVFPELPSWIWYKSIDSVYGGCGYSHYFE